jgi:hypothetical protein
MAAEIPSIPCSRCQEPLPAVAFNTPEMTACPACSSSIRLLAFPASIRPVEAGSTGELVIVDGDASCFYHAEKKAVITCGYCGRFLCSLCDVDLNGEHLCPPCIEAGRKKGKLKNMDTHRVLYDDVALALTILPLLFCVFPLTAPIALFIAIRHWNSPGSLIQRSKVRYVLAILFASAQVIASIVFGYLIVTGALD